MKRRVQPAEVALTSPQDPGSASHAPKNAPRSAKVKPIALIQELQVVSPVLLGEDVSENVVVEEEEKRAIYSSQLLLQQLQDLRFIGAKQLLARYGPRAVREILEEVTESVTRYAQAPDGIIRSYQGLRLKPGVRSPGIIRWLLQQAEAI